MLSLSLEKRQTKYKVSDCEPLNWGKWLKSAEFPNLSTTNIARISEFATLQWSVLDSVSPLPHWHVEQMNSYLIFDILMYILFGVIFLLQVMRAAVLAAAAAALTAAQQSLFLLERRLLWSEPTEVMNTQQQRPQASHFPADPPYCWWWSPSHSHSWQRRLNGDNTWV